MALRVPKLAYDDVAHIQRDDFLTNYWQYEAGQHVTIIGSTGSGKTYLSFQLLNATITRELPGIVLVMKPRDSTVASWSKKLKLKRVYTWPPTLAQRKFEPPRGWVLWPKLGDYDNDDKILRTQFDRCFRESYAQASGKDAEPRIIFADEVVGISKDLKPEHRSDPNLEIGLKRLWSRGRSLGIGLWAATQRPFDAPLLAYQSPTHIFLAREPDQRNRDRLGEIGGFDSTFLRYVVDPASGYMDEHEFLWLSREGKQQTMAIIGR